MPSPTFRFTVTQHKKHYSDDKPSTSFHLVMAHSITKSLPLWAALIHLQKSWVLDIGLYRIKGSKWCVIHLACLSIAYGSALTLRKWVSLNYRHIILKKKSTYIIYIHIILRGWQKYIRILREEKTVLKFYYLMPVVPKKVIYVVLFKVKLNDGKFNTVF